MSNLNDFYYQVLSIERDPGSWMVWILQGKLESLEFGAQPFQVLDLTSLRWNVPSRSHMISFWVFVFECRFHVFVFQFCYLNLLLPKWILMTTIDILGWLPNDWNLDRVGFLGLKFFNSWSILWSFQGPMRPPTEATGMLLIWSSLKCPLEQMKLKVESCKWDLGDKKFWAGPKYWLQETAGKIVGTRDQLKLHLLERLVNIERVYMERNFQKGELNDI